MFLTHNILNIHNIVLLSVYSSILATLILDEFMNFCCLIIRLFINSQKFNHENLLLNDLIVQKNVFNK